MAAQLLLRAKYHKLYTRTPNYSNRS